MGTGHPLVSSSLLRNWWCTKLDKMSKCLPGVTQTVWLYMFFKFSLLDLDQLQSWIFLEENQGSWGVHSVPLTMLLLPYELTFFPLFVKLCSSLWVFYAFSLCSSETWYFLGDICAVNHNNSSKPLWGWLCLFCILLILGKCSMLVLQHWDIDLYLSFISSW